jgi:hypothetical protein
MLFRTPFQRLPPIDGRRALKALQVGLRLEPNLPYGLDIWEEGRDKVYNVEWDDKGHFRIASFRRGSWEGNIAELRSRILSSEAID